MLGLDLAHGGHLTHGMKLNLSGKLYEVVAYHVRREDLPPELIAKELEIARHQAKEQKKPDAIVEKIAQGKVDKYYKEVVLMEQAFVKDDKKTMQVVITDAVAKIGENIQIRRFARFVLGEGLAKKQENLAEEVAKAAGLK